jgi:hypothetical protein
MTSGEPQMSTNVSVEERLALVEAAVVELQKQVATSQPTNWLQQITGSFKDEPAFEEVIAYGRAIRQASEPIIEIQDEP